VDERGDAAGRLRVGHRVQGDGGLTGGLGAVDLDDAPARQSADAQRHIQGDRTGGDGRDRLTRLLAQPHDRALAEVLVDLRQGQFQRLTAIVGDLAHDVSFSPVARTGRPKLPADGGPRPAARDAYLSRLAAHTRTGVRQCRRPSSRTCARVWTTGRTVDGWSTTKPSVYEHPFDVTRVARPHAAACHHSARGTSKSRHSACQTSRGSTPSSIAWAAVRPPHSVST